MDWFKNRRVFGASALPWSSPAYKGNQEQEFPCPNASAAVASNFLLTVFESWGEAEITDIVNAIRKVAEVYSRE